MTFFFYLGFISRTLAIDKIAREGMGLFIFHSTSSMHSQSRRYLYTFIYLHYDFLVFLITADVVTRQVLDEIYLSLPITQPATTCSKLTIETLEQGVKYVQS